MSEVYDARKCDVCGAIFESKERREVICLIIEGSPRWASTAAEIVHVCAVCRSEIHSAISTALRLRGCQKPLPLPPLRPLLVTEQAEPPEANLGITQQPPVTGGTGVSDGE